MFASDALDVSRDEGRESADAVSRDVLFGRFAGDRSTAMRRAPLEAIFPSIEVSPALKDSVPLNFGESCGIMLERRLDRSIRTGPTLDRLLPLLCAPTTLGVMGTRLAGLLCDFPLAL